MASSHSSPVPDDTEAGTEFADEVSGSFPGDLTDDIDAEFEPLASTADVFTPTQSWHEIGMWMSDYSGFTESLEEAERVLQEYEISTGSQFIVSYKRFSFGKSWYYPDIEVCRANHKIHWCVNDIKKQAHWCPSVVIPYDGVPFIIAGKKVYECRYGHDKGIGSKEKWKKAAEERRKTDPKFKMRSKRVLPSKKVGCKLQISITHIIRFPEFEIKCNTTHYKRRVSDKLKISINKFPSTMEVNHRYYIALSDPKNHTSHKLKDATLTRKAHNMRCESQGSCVRKCSKKRKQKAKIDSYPNEFQVREVSFAQNESGIFTNQDGHKELIPISKLETPSNTAEVNHLESPLTTVDQATSLTVSIPVTLYASRHSEFSDSATNSTIVPSENTLRRTALSDSATNSTIGPSENTSRRTALSDSATNSTIGPSENTSRRTALSDSATNSTIGPSENTSRRTALSDSATNSTIGPSENTSRRTALSDSATNLTTYTATVGSSEHTSMGLGSETIPTIHPSLTMSPGTSLPTVSSTSVATRCAKVLEKLINATMLVENTDKLVELELKANQLLQEAKTSIKSSVVPDEVLVRTNVEVGQRPQQMSEVFLESGSTSRNTAVASTSQDGVNNHAETDRSKQGQKCTNTEEIIDLIDHPGFIIKSVEHVPMPGGAPPSIIYTYSPVNNFRPATIDIKETDQSPKSASSREIQFEYV